MLNNESFLMTLKEFCIYMNIGETKARELLKNPKTKFALKIGNKWYVNKRKLEKWIEQQCE